MSDYNAPTPEYKEYREWKGLVNTHKAHADLLERRLEQVESSEFFWRCTSVVLVLIAIVGFYL